MDPAEVIMEEAKARQKPILDAAARGDSEIQRFFTGTTSFITGGTGFLGKLLIEKLIRSCNVKKIYVIIRSKKGMSIEERLAALLKDSVFDTLREMNQEFGNKITPIEGDVAELQLGLSVQSWVTIAEEVDVIFHMAATTRFDETLRKATLINLRGTREILSLAKQCKNLRSFVYVSTAYCQATRDRINSEVLEQFYPSAIHPDALIGMAESMADERLVCITKELIDGWPNTYTFTKAVAEELVRSNLGDLPACVVRPPIVLGSYAEPSPGWLDPSCIYGASGWFLSIIIGISHVIMKSNVRACVAPADYVTNAIIASAAETRNRHDNSDKKLKIYTMSSGSKLSFGNHNKFIRSEKCRSLVSPKAVWYCWGVETSNKFIFWLLFWILHYIPGYIVDTLLFLLRLKLPEGIPSVVRVYTKMYKSTLVLSYFLINEWTFKDDNTVDLYNRLSTTDKVLFNFNIKSIVFEEYIIIYGLGIRKFIIKDGLKDTEKGVRLQSKLKIANFIFFVVYAYIAFKIFCTIYHTILYVM
ncbi:fatty acyl-CoA reductase wat [Manduca sexta]|uniref:fatty acyl-CoA reductase wat n=1 Tax=Manduca sexta TaxID=7130 RepID=UPI0018900054|nr:fatty acyl-CoA reductase wat [Manduca sexta]